MLILKNKRSIYFITLQILFFATSSLLYSRNIPDNIYTLLKKLTPLSNNRGDRELLYQYSIGDLSSLSDRDKEMIIGELAKRGVGVITFWRPGKEMETCIEEGIRIAKIQEKSGLSVVVDASKLLYGFYDKTPSTSHVNREGITYSDSSFAGIWMGCPFTVQNQVPIITSRVTAYVEAYRAAGVNIDIVTADWEIDGPLEWNDAWINSKKCVLCQANIANIQDFSAFQATIRSLRSNLLKKSFTQPVLQRYPEALITNYATYPNDGWRYWYDYYESPQRELPNIKDQQALYRPWYDEFTETGFTMAMPVVYTWYPIFNWYPDYRADYRWFYNMLKVGTNAGKSTPQGIPIATFVHWHITAPPDNPDSDVKQMSKDSYQELLWHLLLRGHDIFFSWCMRDEIAVEMSLLQEVYNNSLEYNSWIQSGRPVFFEVPIREGSVISGLRVNDQILVRRTDFKDNIKPIKCTIDGRLLLVPYKPGECQIISLEK
jgi:hypothetical protein